MRKIINKDRALIWDDYKFKFKGRIHIIYELTNRLIFNIREHGNNRNIYCYNKQTGKKIWQIAPSIGEDGKLIGYGYLGIGIEIMQDDGELIGTSKLIPLEDYKKIEAPFESEFDNFGYVPFLDRAFDPTKDKLIAECDVDGARFDYWVDWDSGEVELFNILSKY
ncbi:hypothetical protein [uncultured Gammaproteobacteria bacterium]|jgi:hypothetical protein|nr:hypothetical protein [uncultured Gammaproteobacteria bacterium]